MIYVFYHICCKPGIEEIVRDQATKILFSGLYDRATTIYCSLVGSEMANLLHIQLVLRQYGSKFVTLGISETDDTYERFTLNRIKGIVKPEDKLLYLHSKGITHHNKPSSLSVSTWRTMMEYFLIRHHERCITDLDMYDAVGIMWHGTQAIHFNGNVYMHFSGNFWWTTGAYLHRLPTEIGDNYWDPEMWIGKANPQIKCYHDPPSFNHYHDIVWPSQYV